MKIVLKILIFLALGELIFQAHKHWGIDHIMDVKEEPASLTKPDSIANTIFLLGDSYTKGLGILKENRLASTIKADGYFVADYSHSSDNWVDYVSTIQALEDKLRPNDIIVIGVNWNDIQFNKGAIHYLFNTAEQEISRTSIKKLQRNTKPKGLRRAVHFLYRNSALISFLSSNVQNTLKRHGMPLPIGDFHYLKEKAYPEKKDEMHEAIQYLQRVNLKHQTTSVLYLMPDFNLTKNIEYFASFNHFFMQYDGTNGITILDGPAFFANAVDGHYCLSIHDGHPNDAAHMSIGQQISAVINNTPPPSTVH